MTPPNISVDVYILTARDLDDREAKAFQRGVERGRFEERAALGKEPLALNCKNWSDGKCENCGVQRQYFEVDGLFKCPHFSARGPK
jgi:hypothetical protein